MKQLLVTLLIACGLSRTVVGEIRGNSDLKPSPTAYTVLFFPDNYKSNPQCTALLNGFATDPALIELRAKTYVQTYTASDPDFRNRWATKVPSVATGQPAAVVLQDDQVLWGAVSPTVEQMAGAMRGGVLMRLRPLCNPDNPYCPTCPNRPNQPQPYQPYQPTTQPDRPILPNTPLTPETTNPIIPTVAPVVFDDKLQKLEEKLTAAINEQKAAQEKLIAQITQFTQNIQNNNNAAKVDLSPILLAIQAMANKPSQQIDLKPILDAITALNTNKPDSTAVLALLNQIKEQTTQPTPPTVTSSPLVLVTSDVLCESCSGVTAKARELRDKKGLDIRLVKLTGVLRGLSAEQKANLKLEGVPCLYDFKESRTIVGADPILEYLNSL